ncbi:MAG: PaaI family thioesterase [Alphaproteobacteria bacterium]|nr:PaaI family thioesterase [Alphaproteobacteria bacterium]
MSTADIAPRDARPIPEGFEESTHGGPFSSRNGPYYLRRTGDARIIKGLYVDERHLNGLGLAHGGMLMAFADNICATAAIAAARSAVVTVRMTTDFLAPAHEGEWLEGVASPLRVTRSLVFIEGEGAVGGRAVFRTSAIFKIVARQARRPRGE